MPERARRYRPSSTGPNSNGYRAHPSDDAGELEALPTMTTFTIEPEAAAGPVADPMATPLLELRGVRACYDRIEVLHGVDLTVAGGSIVGILGPNGAGKTTLLKVIAGLMKPTGGRVLFEGHDLTGTHAEQLSKIGVCLIPEGRGIFPNLTVKENILMDSFSAHGRKVSELEAIAYDRFPRLGERRNQVAGTMSGGEQQMLSLARALTTDPALILLDELSMGLAPLVVEELFEVVQGLARSGITTVIVEQFAEMVLEFADQIAVLTQGVVRLAGEPSQVRHQLAATYLGGA